MQFIQRILILVLLATIASPLAAQIKRGDRYFYAGDYARSIPAYERGLRNKNDVKAMENLANAYRITKNYVKAEEWYGKTVAANPNCNPLVHYYYAMVLKNNNKIPEAKTELMKFMGQEPNSQLGKEQVEALDNFQLWLSQTPLYAVNTVGGLNSKESDMSPVFYGNGLMFSSDRGETDVLNGENAGSGRAFYSIYYTDKKSENEDSVVFGKPKKLSRDINKDFHNGPLSVTADGKMMAFNRVANKVKVMSNGYVNRPQIFFAEKKGKSSWGKITAFQYNNEKYSFAHPALSADGNTLYFASDMEGTMGGNDIWMSKKDANGWSKPVNLGASINTPGNEVFPYVRKDGMLFFSSDGHGGMGGLDIFSSANENGTWSEAVNQGVPLNGTTDDFGVVFNDEGTRGYFTSDRAGGKGLDDVYSFKVTAKFVNIRGTLLSSKNANEIVPNTKVELLTKDGKLVKTTTTDANGNFKFDNLASDQNYIVRLNEEDPGLTRPKYYMTDEGDKLIRVTVLDEVGGKFTFQNLPVDPAAPPQLLADDEYLTIAGNLIADGNPPSAIANTKVDLKDEQGNTVQTTTTNEFGAFAFTHVPPDMTYIVAVAEGSGPKLAPNSTVSITNKSGKSVMTTTPDANGKFQFRILPTDQNTISAMSVTEPELRMDLRGTLTGADANNTALANTKVNMINEKGEVIASTTTDERGYFNFQNVPSDQAYIMSVDEVKDPNLAALGKLYVKDDKGKVVKTLKMSRNGKYEFRILPMDKTTLGYVYVEDPWLQVLQMKAKQSKDSLTIIENIYYDYGSAEILPSAENTLQKVVKVMQLDPSITIEISSHTDSRAANDYNQRLSQKRAQNVVDYLVKRGIDKKRLTAVGYGETRLLNNCKDGSNCSEDEHAKNRRTEFKINKK